MPKNLATWIFNLHIVPSGYLTKAAGWVGVLVALLCVLGHAVPGVPCPVDPQTALVTGVTGLIGIGLGRRP